ncbi:MAG: hypothetical protein M3O31_11890 [Acidobacteriota bacterium]|nr:hypothetical protein [Acidobacteriota bacterium]
MRIVSRPACGASFRFTASVVTSARSTALRQLDHSILVVLHSFREQTVELGDLLVKATAVVPVGAHAFAGAWAAIFPSMLRPAALWDTSTDHLPAAPVLPLARVWRIRRPLDPNKSVTCAVSISGATQLASW